MIIHISRDIQDGIDNVLNYIASDKNNMAQHRSSVIPRGKTIMRQKTKKETRKQWEPIEIESFYLLKTAQSLIEETVEMMHQQYFPDQEEGARSQLLSGNNSRVGGGRSEPRMANEKHQLF